MYKNFRAGILVLHLFLFIAFIVKTFKRHISYPSVNLQMILQFNEPRYFSSNKEKELRELITTFIFIKMFSRSAINIYLKKYCYLNEHSIQKTKKPI